MIHTDEQGEYEVSPTHEELVRAALGRIEAQGRMMQEGRRERIERDRGVKVPSQPGWVNMVPVEDERTKEAWEPRGRYQGD
jgi:hypothetical protein